MAAVISGDAHLCVDPLASALGHIRGGTVRAIAVAAFGPTLLFGIGQ
jgi:tripartite-type tricarboxylate transporter receptor subunit TctC